MIDNNDSEVSNVTIHNDNLIFLTSVNSESVYEYNMYVSDYFNNTHPPANGSSVEYNATLGVGERLYGFSEKRFNDLSSLDYSDFKAELKYPLNRDASVYVYDSVDFSTLLFNYNVSEPTADDNVYVVSWSDVLINESGGIEQITVLIKTW